jgi:hypothetical protein
MIEGNPTKVLRVLHHLLFRTSKKFTNEFLCLRVNPEVQYLPDGKFYRNICLLLVSHLCFYVWIE